jgi:hypothetical protein
MTRRRAKIAPRRRIFLGCEGASEVSYAALLQRLADNASNARVHIVRTTLNPGAGDPRQLVKRAAQIIRDQERIREPFSLKAILLDRAEPELCMEAARLAEKEGIDQLVWQDPDHEALLLRHLPNCQQLRPPRGKSMEALLRVWPGYVKGAPVADLAQRIGFAQLVSTSAVEPELRTLLISIGFSLEG